MNSATCCLMMSVVFTICPFDTSKLIALVNDLVGGVVVCVRTRVPTHTKYLDDGSSNYDGRTERPTHKFKLRRQAMVPSQ
jgi:hypothetical protein